MKGPVKGTLYVFIEKAGPKANTSPETPEVSSSPCISNLTTLLFYQVLSSFSSYPLDYTGLPSQGTLSMGHPGPLSPHCLTSTPGKFIPAATKGHPRKSSPDRNQEPSTLHPKYLHCSAAQRQALSLSQAASVETLASHHTCDHVRLRVNGLSTKV